MVALAHAVSALEGLALRIENLSHGFAIRHHPFRLPELAKDLLRRGSLPVHRESVRPLPRGRSTLIATGSTFGEQPNRLGAPKTMPAPTGPPVVTG